MSESERSSQSGTADIPFLRKTLCEETTFDWVKHRFLRLSVTVDLVVNRFCHTFSYLMDSKFAVLVISIHEH